MKQWLTQNGRPVVVALLLVVVIVGDQLGVLPGGVRQLLEPLLVVRPSE